MGAVEAEGLSAPQSAQNCQRLVHDLGPHLEAHCFSYFVKASVIFRRAESDPEDQPAARKMIERHYFTSQLPGSAPGNGRDQRAYPDPLSPHSYHGQRHLGIEPWHVGLALDTDRQCVGNEHAIPSGFLGRLCQIPDCPRLTTLYFYSIFHYSLTP